MAASVAFCGPLDGCEVLPGVKGGMQCGQALLVVFDASVLYAPSNSLGDTYAEATSTITRGIADALNHVVSRSGTVWAAGMLRLPEGEVRLWRVKAEKERGWAASAFRREGAWAICLAPTGPFGPRDPHDGMLPGLTGTEARAPNKAAFQACKNYVAQVAIGDPFTD